MPANLLPGEIAPPGYATDWTPQHRMAVAMDIAGFTRDEIADRLNVTDKFVTRAVGDPRAEVDRGGALAEYAESVTLRLQEVANEALDVALEVMRDGEKDETRLKASFGLLDRAGHSPIKRELQIKTELPADAGLLDMMRETLAETASREIRYEIRPKQLNIELIPEAEVIGVQSAAPHGPVTTTVDSGGEG